MPNLSLSAQQKISKLKDDYVASLPDKLENLNKSWQENFNESCDSSHLESLRVSSHKLAGSAGSYGLKEISNTARIFEKKCADFIKSKKQDAEITDNLRQSYQELITVIQEAIHN